MIWVILVGHFFDEPEQVRDESVIHLHQVLHSQSLNTRHLVHEVQQVAVQAWVNMLAAIDQLKQSGEASLVDHAGKRGLILTTIQQQEAGDGVQRPRLVLLEQAVYDLRTDVFLVSTEEVAGEEHVGAGRSVILGFGEVVAELRSEVEPGAEGIVDRLVAVAFGRDASVEICRSVVSVLTDLSRCATASSLNQPTSPEPFLILRREGSVVEIRHGARCSVLCVRGRDSIGSWPASTKDALEVVEEMTGRLTMVGRGRGHLQHGAGVGKSECGLQVASCRWSGGVSGGVEIMVDLLWSGRAVVPSLHPVAGLAWAWHDQHHQHQVDRTLQAASELKPRKPDSNISHTACREQGDFSANHRKSQRETATCLGLRGFHVSHGPGHPSSIIHYHPNCAQDNPANQAVG